MMILLAPFNVSNNSTYKTPVHAMRHPNTPRDTPSGKTLVKRINLVVTLLKNQLSMRPHSLCTISSMAQTSRLFVNTSPWLDTRSFDLICHTPNSPSFKLFKSKPFYCIQRNVNNPILFFKVKQRKS